MSLFKANTLSKGIMLMITGLIVAFFPGVISKMFYLIGMDSFGYGEIIMDCNRNPYKRYKYTHYCDKPFPMLLHILS